MLRSSWSPAAVQHLSQTKPLGTGNAKAEKIVSRIGSGTNVLAEGVSTEISSDVIQTAPYQFNGHPVAPETYADNGPLASNPIM